MSDPKLEIALRLAEMWERAATKLTKDCEMWKRLALQLADQCDAKDAEMKAQEDERERALRPRD